MGIEDFFGGGGGGGMGIGLFAGFPVPMFSSGGGDRTLSIDNSVTNNYYGTDAANLGSGSANALNGQMNGCRSCQSKDGGQSDFAPPGAGASSQDIDLEGFEGSQKLVSHDGESYIEFYDKQGNHIDTLKTSEFEDLQEAAADGDKDAIADLERLGASDELIDNLGGKGDGQCCQAMAAKPETVDSSISYNPATDQWDVSDIHSFESYDDAVADYRSGPQDDGGIRRNPDTHLWETNDIQSFDSLQAAAQAAGDIDDDHDAHGYTDVNDQYARTSRFDDVNFV